MAEKKAEASAVVEHAGALVEVGEGHEGLHGSSVLAQQAQARGREKPPPPGVFSE